MSNCREPGEPGCCTCTELFQCGQCGQDWGSLALPACPSPEGAWCCWEGHAAGREGASLEKENWSRDLSVCACVCVCICKELEASTGIYQMQNEN